MKMLRWMAVAALVTPALAMAATWEKVPLVDHMCADKVKGNPDAHKTSCLLKCASSGYGILTASGAWLKLDEAGNEKAVAALKKTSKADHVRVNVTGEQKGDVIAVSSLAIPD
ncbi:MAG TPA: hypothetical protein VLU43_11955 [Anaeromyxobacteraceae bacterium]|nr:hypothetical protein [Anaeromyxobacteraceae bacterium]